jgi:hypothetical protein
VNHCREQTVNTLPGLRPVKLVEQDVVFTPEDVAIDVIKHFAPSGRILDPCKGDGAFYRNMPGAEWCEISEGRDFFEWKEPVDWIVSNPPYSIFSHFLRHSCAVAENIVYLIPINKPFNSDKMMREIYGWGGIKTIYVIGGGASLGFPIGFCIGAVHFLKGYEGCARIDFRKPMVKQ